MGRELTYYQVTNMERVSGVPLTEAQRSAYVTLRRLPETQMPENLFPGKQTLTAQEFQSLSDQRLLAAILALTAEPEVVDRFTHAYKNIFHPEEFTARATR